MTKGQRKLHKMGNQIRKARLIRFAYKNKDWAMAHITAGLPQNGRFTVK